MAHQEAARLARANGARALSGRVRVPGDRFLSHHALILGGLASGRTRITGLARSEGMGATERAMRAMGARIERDGEALLVDGTGNGCLLEPEGILDFGASGIGACLAMGLAGTYDFTATFAANASLSARPMGGILDPLRQMGTQVLSRSRQRFPLSLRGPRIAAPVTWRLRAPSVRLKSAVLLAGLNAPGLTTVIEPAATSDHAETMLARFGAVLEFSSNAEGERTIRLAGQGELKGIADLPVPGDPSLAAFIALAAVIVPGSHIVLENVLASPRGTGLFETLVDMGASIEFEHRRTVGGNDVIDLQVRHSSLRGVAVPARRMLSLIDELPALVIAAAFAEGVTHLEGLGEPQATESPSLAQGLAANGVAHEFGGHRLSITGRPDGKGLGGGTLAGCVDHRVAMGFLVLGLAGEKPVTVEDGSGIEARFPEFASLIGALGGRLEGWAD